MKTVILAIFLTLVGGSVFLAVRNGVFRPVKMTIEEQGPFNLLQKVHVGAYDKVVADLDEVEHWAKAANVACPQTFGEYLEDPNVVESARLHANVGCVVEGNIPARKPSDYSVRVVPRRRYVVGTFDGSPALGPYKVYGKAQDIMREQRLVPDGPVIELYLVRGTNVTTTYLFPVK